MPTHPAQTGGHGPGELADKARAAEVLGLTPQRVSQLEGQAGFPAPYAELQIGKVWLLDDILAYEAHRQQQPPPRLRLGPADKRWKQAEELVIARINALPGWRAANANEVGRVQPGWDVFATHQPTGRTVTVSVKSISTVTSARKDFAIGRASSTPGRPRSASGCSTGSAARKTGPCSTNQNQNASHRSRRNSAS